MSFSYRSSRDKVGTTQYKHKNGKSHILNVRNMLTWIRSSVVEIVKLTPYDKAHSVSISEVPSLTCMYTGPKDSFLSIVDENLFGSHGS